METRGGVTNGNYRTGQDFIQTPMGHSQPQISRGFTSRIAAAIQFTTALITIYLLVFQRVTALEIALFFLLGFAIHK